ncbi:hypothetical protein HRG84_18315 [Flavisolibacter sp. BT320]|nr:hypothetical protein [Flavisolibacter longurius]
MKRIVVSLLVVIIGAAQVQAQKGKKAVSRKATVQSDIQSKTSGQDTINLTSTAAYPAYGAGANRFSISDPIVNTFRQRANDVPATFNGRSIVGMPGSTYGIANGRILLRNTTATTPGTSYGSGAVGTGTTLLGVGAGENAISVNGKNPYAGPGLWGSKQPGVNLAPFRRDSTGSRQ